ARIDGLVWERRPPRGEVQFRIEASQDDVADAVFVGADVATCDECLAELFDPADRRVPYPFLNRTQCGPPPPHLTPPPHPPPRHPLRPGVPSAPARTPMPRSPLCAAPRAEHETPADRRFHAQPTACPACGPRLRLLDALGKPVECGDPITAVADAVRGNRIVAM